MEFSQKTYSVLKDGLKAMSVIESYHLRYFDPI